METGALVLSGSQDLMFEVTHGRIKDSRPEQIWIGISHNIVKQSLIIRQ
jgi:hypothetical protein